MRDWTDGADPYDAASMILRPDGRFGISDAAWSAHLLGLQRVLVRDAVAQVAGLALGQVGHHRDGEQQRVQQRRGHQQDGQRRGSVKPRCA